MKLEDTLKMKKRKNNMIFNTYLELPLEVCYDWDEDILYLIRVGIVKRDKTGNITGNCDILTYLEPHFIKQLERDAKQHWNENVKKQMEPSE